MTQMHTLTLSGRNIDDLSFSAASIRMSLKDLGRDVKSRYKTGWFGRMYIILEWWE